MLHADTGQALWCLSTYSNASGYMYTVKAGYYAILLDY